MLCLLEAMESELDMLGDTEGSINYRHAAERFTKMLTQIQFAALETVTYFCLWSFAGIALSG